MTEPTFEQLFATQKLPRPEWRHDDDWAAQYDPDVQAILARHAIEFVRFEPASFLLDTRQATDIVVVTDVGTIAKRIRRDRCSFRDITLRYRRLVNGEWKRGYEVDKILSGYARAYIYAWVRRER